MERVGVCGGAGCVAGACPVGAECAVEYGIQCADFVGIWRDYGRVHAGCERYCPLTCVELQHQSADVSMHDGWQFMHVLHCNVCLCHLAWAPLCTLVC